MWLWLGPSPRRVSANALQQAWEGQARRGPAELQPRQRPPANRDVAQAGSRQNSAAPALLPRSAEVHGRLSQGRPSPPCIHPQDLDDRVAPAQSLAQGGGSVRHLLGVAEASGDAMPTVDCWALCTSAWHGGTGRARWGAFGLLAPEQQMSLKSQPRRGVGSVDEKPRPERSPRCPRPHSPAAPVPGASARLEGQREGRVLRADSKWTRSCEALGGGCCGF